MMSMVQISSAESLRKIQHTTSKLIVHKLSRPAQNIKCQIQEEEPLTYASSYILEYETRRWIKYGVLHLCFILVASANMTLQI